MVKVDWIDWSEIPDEKVKQFGRMFSENPSQELIENVSTQFKLLKVREGLYFPVTINNTEYNDSFVCSPYTAHIH